MFTVSQVCSSTEGSRKGAAFTAPEDEERQRRSVRSQTFKL
jgi:hypothetical protein